MKHGIPTCQDPIDPKSIYLRNLFREFFWGPFKDVDEVVSAINQLDIVDPYWDYDPFTIVHGLTPLPTDYVFGFPSVSDEIKNEIYLRRLRR